MANKINLDSEKLSKLHIRLCEKLLEGLEAEDIFMNPKFLDIVVKFLDNNNITCSPLTDDSTEDRASNLRTILSEMTDQFEKESAVA